MRAHFAPTGYPRIKLASQQIFLITTYAACKDVMGVAIITAIRFHMLRKRPLLRELFCSEIVLSWHKHNF